MEKEINMLTVSYFGEELTFTDDQSCDWIAIDGDGQCYLYQEKPKPCERNNPGWDTESGYEFIGNFPELLRGHHWKDTLRNVADLRVVIDSKKEKQEIEFNAAKKYLEQNPKEHQNLKDFILDGIKSKAGKKLSKPELANMADKAARGYLKASEKDMDAIDPAEYIEHNGYFLHKDRVAELEAKAEAEANKPDPQIKHVPPEVFGNLMTQHKMDVDDSGMLGAGR